MQLRVNITRQAQVCKCFTTSIAYGLLCCRFSNQQPGKAGRNGLGERQMYEKDSDVQYRAAPILHFPLFRFGGTAARAR